MSTSSEKCQLIADRVRALELPGIEYREEPDWPGLNGNEFARNLLGQVDRMRNPNGIELQFADLLAGQSGSRATGSSVRFSKAAGRGP